ncbi:radical SAM protein [Acetivibrio mesophilus]|uniref:Radical SAM protein n=1 Tax=Acetivibrio mesophilus TaxID=2487273 RepID=A0A4Q0I7T6_9FIRM|nr:radical SAM protein [Acetivibrio mesophilus]ODM26125.1 metallo cofactor biosynthesis protein [Clostridium sp. Bc-iso-3]RXE59092.1 radical SAM protein [Acetivibrio mesophilus]HHV29497.1 radical SAM protein [Clostridium sp.]
MKINHLIKLGAFGISTILFRRKKAILGTIILTDKCNLHCKHCSVNNITSVVYSYTNIRREMEYMYKQGIRILFFCGGETFLWSSENKTLRDLVREAKEMGFYIVNVVTNGTYKLNLPEADLILLSLDGDRERHNIIRGDTYDTIMKNIDEAASDNICLYMAINKINQTCIRQVCDVAKNKPAVKAVSFNFHTPYPDTEELELSIDEKKNCCDTISELIDMGYPVFNLKSAFPYIVDNSFPTPCHQCVVMENGKLTVCGRCIDVPGLCEKCGYFFAAEYTLVFSGKIKIAIDMLRTYLRYI